MTHIILFNSNNIDDKKITYVQKNVLYILFIAMQLNIYVNQKRKGKKIEKKKSDSKSICIEYIQIK